MPTRKLTADDVRQARRRAAAGEPIRQIARDYPVTYTTIRNAIRGLAWSNITDPPPVDPNGNNRTKLTKAEVLEARRRRQQGELVQDLAEELGVHQSTMSQAINGETWSHLAQPLPEERCVPQPQASAGATPCRRCGVLTDHRYCVYCRREGHAPSWARPETNHPGTRRLEEFANPHMGVV